MNPNPYIAVFAGISITALSLQIIESYWLPMALGVGVTVLIARWAR
ncbi:hypothetical protein OKA05_08705 [Luteolibacter arcticus]|uniref:Uncharacterized protein n=1 Tax=Luteolibacter arcticus TaxID=1581411 RepID=A0ABT3GG84_9BACT|nr:hypothetical protein [Luteolibacter arcticus]MCW1922632.1 hypothetical protein [Luteolibacter arcticus]